MVRLAEVAEPETEANEVVVNVEAFSIKGEQPMMDAELFHRQGLELLERLHGGHAGEAMVAEMRDVCPFFADMTIDWALGGVMARPVSTC